MEVSTEAACLVVPFMLQVLYPAPGGVVSVDGSAPRCHLPLGPLPWEGWLISAEPWAWIVTRRLPSCPWQTLPEFSST